MPPKKPIIIIGVLCVISLGLGYWYGLPGESSGGGGGNGDPKEPEFLKQGLVAYYPFNGNAKDESGNGNDGEVKGPKITEDRHRKKDSAFFFGIQEAIQLPNNLLDGEEEATITAWVLSEHLGGAGAIMFAGDERSAFDPICARLKGGMTPYIQFADCVNGGQNGVDSAPENVRASITVPSKKWSFFSMVLSRINDASTPLTPCPSLLGGVLRTPQLVSQYLSTGEALIAVWTL